MPATTPGRRRPTIAAALILSSLAFTHALAGDAGAQAALGFVETFPGIGIGSWGGGSVESNPGSGGTGGATDGYLLFSSPNGAQHNLGVRAIGQEYTGSWIVAGITQVRLWLNDVGADDPLEMHFSVGAQFINLWQYNVGFLPPHNQWAEFVVDLSSPANWTRVIGTTGTFAEALGAVEVVHVRHDQAPFVQNPNPLDGDVGLDHLLLTNGTASVPGGGPQVPRALQLSTPTPNPSRGAVTFSLQVFEAGSVRLEIVDALGRRVRGAELAGAGPGTLTWIWDGRDDAGRPTAAGVYRVRALGRSGGMSRGLVRVE